MITSSGANRGGLTDRAEANPVQDNRCNHSTDKEMITIDFKIGERNNNNKLYSGLSHVWSHMMERCYRPDCPEYKYYGAKGVHVCFRWHTFNNFLGDVDKVDGWDLDMYLQGRLQLDKDIKFEKNYLYSLTTCKWVTKEENLRHLPTTRKKILGISPEGDEYLFYNQTEFAKKHNLIQGHISAVIRGERAHHKRWLFKIIRDDYALEPKTPHKLFIDHYVAYLDGVEVAVNRYKAVLLRELGLPIHDNTLAKVYDGGTIQRYTFSVEKRPKYNYD